MMPSPPVVLCLSGHDPTGGAGIQADIETLFRLNCHPCTVVTALTAQDTSNVRQLYPQSPAALLEQARLLMADVRLAAIKIGLLGSADIARAVAQLLAEAGPLPVVFDPVLAAGGGHDMAGAELLAVIREAVLPKVTVVTPNTVEAARLTGAVAADDCAALLQALGCPHVLITGTHADSPDVVNRWYGGGQIDIRGWPRLPGSYHGSGCTLAAALSGYLALGLPMADAVAEAQCYTHAALTRAYPVGQGQSLPGR